MEANQQTTTPAARQAPGLLLPPWQWPIRLRLRARIIRRRLLAIVVAGAMVVASDQLDRSKTEDEPGRDPTVGTTTSTALGSVVDSAGRHGLAPDERAIAIVPPAAPLPLISGDHVELVAVGFGNDGIIRTYVIGPAVRVVSVSSDAIVVAVPAEMAPLIIDSAANGAIELMATP